MSIHQMAMVDPTALIGAGTTIGAGALIEEGVVIGRDCQIAAYAIVRKFVTLGDGVQIDSFSVVGGDPQSIGFDSSLESYVVIGDRTILRESVTVHRPETVGSQTSIGEDCFIMANAHVAHDCQIGNGVVVANNVMLAGHVHIDEKTVIGGGAGIHQFCRIGASCMIAGNATIIADVPHYVMAAERSKAHGLNLLGLKRAGYNREEIKDLKACYRAVFYEGVNFRKKADELSRGDDLGMTPAGKRFLAFFREGKRGYIQSTRG